MTGHSIRVSQLDGGARIIEAMTGNVLRDPVRAAVAWTDADASESFDMLIGAIGHPR